MYFNFFQNKDVFFILYRRGFTALLFAPRWTETVNYEPVKVSNLEVRRNFPKTAFFNFWTYAMLLLKPCSPGVLWEICI